MLTILISSRANRSRYSQLRSANLSGDGSRLISISGHIVYDESYLYAASSQITPTITNSFISHFWAWGSALNSTVRT